MNRPASQSQQECSNLLKQGEFDQALRSAMEWTRQHPADADLRIGLFQLLAASGQWGRAREQLKLSATLDAERRELVAAYSRVLDAELEREQVMSGQMMPLMLGKVGQWQHDLLLALRQDRDGLAVEAAQRRGVAFAQAEAAGGSIDGVRFEWLCDADPRFGPCLEVVLETGYAWVAFSQLRELILEAPVSLRDLLWQPATLVWRNGDAVAGMVPCRYPGSEHSDQAALRLGRRTDWSGTDIAARGIGQRMLITDHGDHPLLDIRHIEFDASEFDAPPGEAPVWPS